MKKHAKKSKAKKMVEGSAAEEAMESPEEEAMEGGMKKGGKVKKSMKAEGAKSKARLDKPARKANGGKIDQTDDGVGPNSPMAKMKKGGKC